jgi:hypothetical protein
MILHVCNLDKFIPPFVKLINEEFGEQNHQFWVAGSQKLKQHPIENADNIFIARRSIVAQVFAHIRLLFMMHRAKKVILHGLFNHRVIILLALCPWLLGRCYWVIWGGDLYSYQKNQAKFKKQDKREPPKIRDQAHWSSRYLHTRRCGTRPQMVWRPR